MKWAEPFGTKQTQFSTQKGSEVVYSRATGSDYALGAQI